MTTPEDNNAPEDFDFEAESGPGPDARRSSYAPSLPSTKAELLAQRRIVALPNLNDAVDAVHVVLWEGPEYRKLWEAVYDEDAVYGACSYDHVFIAQEVYQYAVQHNIDLITGKKLATIGKSLAVVGRRYRIDRKFRRNAVGGETVFGGNNEE